MKVAEQTEMFVLSIHTVIQPQVKLAVGADVHTRIIMGPNICRFI